MKKQFYWVRGVVLVAIVLCCLCITAGCHSIRTHVSTPGQSYEAELSRTSYGVPHIKGDSDGDVGFGLGYAMAEDQIDNILDFITTANGERSKFFGPNKSTSSRFNNLKSDIYQKWQNSDAAVAKYRDSLSPEILAGFEGMASGINQYLEDYAENLPTAVDGAAWVRPVTVNDLIKLNRHYSTILQVGAPGTAGAIVAAALSGTIAAASKGDTGNKLAVLEAQHLEMDERGASNAAAFGSTLTENGSGLLFGNPHLYNFGETRLYLFHITNPGNYDVFGSGFMGELYPEVGFNQNVAFTGTISRAQRLTYFELELDPSDPTAYMVDGVSEPMTVHELSLEVLQEDGSVATEVHKIYESRYGPVLSKEGFEWTNERAFAVRDVNLENYNLNERLRGVAKASSVEDIHKAQASTLGNPWLQTTAADDQGNVYYGNVSPVPNVSDKMLDECVSEEFQPLLKGMGIYKLEAGSVVVLDGSRSECNWLTDAESPRDGVFPGSKLPWMIRSDFVQNSNDSSWYTNPATPQEGFPYIVSRDNIPMGPRTQMGLTQIEELIENGKVSADKFLEVAFSNRVLMAERHLDQLLEVCGPIELDDACDILSAWDREADLESIGYILFETIWKEIRKLNREMVFSPVDMNDPVNAPAELLTSDQAVADLVQETFIQSVQAMDSMGIDLDATLADNQLGVFGGVPIFLPGAIEGMGVYNRCDVLPMQVFNPTAPASQRMIIGGATHIQAVTFGPDGPVNHSALGHSQSSDPASAHVNDLTKVYAAGEWVSFPFSSEEIAADPNLTVKTVNYELAD